MNQVKTPIVFLVFLSFLFISSCKKETSNQIEFPNEESRQLIGTWNWLQSSGGFGGTIQNPTTEGLDKQVKFNQKGEYSRLTNGELDYYLNYHFVEDISIVTGEKRYLINFVPLDKNSLPFGRLSYEFISLDTLVLFDECYDCYTHLYVLDK